jgi:hypothetical protein
MTLGNVFSNQISEGLVRMRKNAEAAKLAMQTVAAAEKMGEEFGGLGGIGRINSKGEEQLLKEQEIQEKILHLKTRMDEADQQDLNINEQKLEQLEKEERILSKLVAHSLPDSSVFNKKD